MSKDLKGGTDIATQTLQGMLFYIKGEQVEALQSSLLKKQQGGQCGWMSVTEGEGGKIMTAGEKEMGV